MKDTNSLAHTSYGCKYHIVLVPKYRRMIIYNRLRRDIVEIIKILLNRKPDVRIIEGGMFGPYTYVVRNTTKICSSRYNGVFEIKINIDDI